MSLQLTDAGRRAEKGVRRIEDAMYDQLDAAFAGVDTAALVQQLERLVAGRPSGLALEARIAAER